MFVVLELISFASLLVVVWVIYRAANARPDEPSLLLMARAALAIWIGFVLYRFFQIDAIVENAAAIVKAALIIALISAAVIGYRIFLRRARNEADRR